MATEIDSEMTVSDSIGYFIDDQRYHGKSQRTIDAYERVLRRFDDFVDREFDVGIDSAGRRECMAWVHSLRGSYEESTIATYASYVNRFFEYMTRVDIFESNPMAVVTEEMSETIDTNPTRRELTVEEMRSFVDSVSHPLPRALVVTLLKTGMRVGELCNLDMQDIYLDTSDVEGTFEHSGRKELRIHLERRPNSLYVSPEPSLGTSVNGEERSASNKRVRETILPVDDELRRVLIDWLAIRPDPISTANPLFLDTRDEWGERLTPQDVRYYVEKYARERGWYRTGGGPTENVTPHYFRHFFTTHLRDRTGDRGVVQYLRGDVAGDVIDTYTHNWGEQVRSVYESNIYSLC